MTENQVALTAIGGGLLHARVPSESVYPCGAALSAAAPCDISGGRAATTPQAYAVSSDSSAEIRGVFRLRYMIEPALAVCSLPKYSPRWLDKLSRLADAVSSTATPVDLSVQAYKSFHLGIVAPAASSTELRSLMPLHREIQLLFVSGARLLGIHPAESEDSGNSYHRIVGAVRSGDAVETRSLLEHHLSKNEEFAIRTAGLLGIRDDP